MAAAEQKQEVAPPAKPRLSVVGGEEPLPTTQDGVATLMLERNRLLARCRELEAECAALRAIDRSIKDAPRDRRAIAKTRLLGAGRREIAIGECLTDDELVGLDEGVHYEIR